MVMSQHQDAKTVSSPTDAVQLNEILAAVEQLSVQDKSTLVNHILGGSGLSIILSYPALPYTAVQQVRTLDKEGMGEVLEAIAQHLLEGN